MEFNSIQKYQKYKNKYINLKNMNKINNNNITYFKQHGSGLFEECRNSGIYMIVGGVELDAKYKDNINPMTNNVIGIRKDMTSCEFFNLFKGFYKLKSDSDTLIEIINTKESESIIEIEIPTLNSNTIAPEKDPPSHPKEKGKGKDILKQKPNKLKLTSSYNFKDFIDNLNKDEITKERNTQTLILTNPFYRNFCKLLGNIKDVFDKLSTAELLTYVTYRDSKKDPTKTQRLFNLFKKTELSASQEIPTISTDVMKLENIYNYFKDSEINNYNKQTFKYYFFVEFSITTSKIISVGGIKEIGVDNLPTHTIESTQ